MALEAEERQRAHQEMIQTHQRSETGKVQRENFRSQLCATARAMISVVGWCVLCRAFPSDFRCVLQVLLVPDGGLPAAPHSHPPPPPDLCLFKMLRIKRGIQNLPKPEPEDVLGRLTTAGGGSPPPPPGPPAQTKVTIAGKNEICNRENLIGPFLVRKLLGPRPPPPFPPLF